MRRARDPEPGTGPAAAIAGLRREEKLSEHPPIRAGCYHADSDSGGLILADPRGQKRRPAELPRERLDLWLECGDLRAYDAPGATRLDHRLDVAADRECLDGKGRHRHDEERPDRRRHDADAIGEAQCPSSHECDDRPDRGVARCREERASTTTMVTTKPGRRGERPWQLRKCPDEGRHRSRERSAAATARTMRPGCTPSRQNRRGSRTTRRYRSAR